MKVFPAEPRFKDYYHPNLLADILAGHAIAPPGWKVTTIHFVDQGVGDRGQGSEKKGTKKEPEKPATPAK